MPIGALDSVAERLADADLESSCSSRPIRAIIWKLGEISSYPPGYKENAGIFCHNNPWIMIAEALLGRGDKAYDYFKRLAPAFLDDDQQLRRTEPYVYAQMIAGPDAATSRRSQEFLAHRNGRLELRRDHAVLAGHPPDARRPASIADDRTAGRYISRTPPLPRRGIRDTCSANSI